MHVVIMGLGSYKRGSGISAAKFFIERGDDVLITDLKTERDLAHQIEELKNFCKSKNKPLPEFVLGRHNEKDFKDADLVLRNPGVPKDSPYLEIAREDGAEIETDVSIFLKNCPAQVVGVTGTRGKSTTATLIYEFLKKSPPTPLFKRGAKILLHPPFKKGERGGFVWLGGNIKISPLSFVSKVKAGDIVVLELSSWMLENFCEKKLAPHIAVVTNIYPDHLNTYKNMAEYIAAKKNIFACQGAGDYLVVNGENKETKRWKRKIPLNPPFAKGETPPFIKGRRGGILYFFKKDAKKYKTMLRGEHNLENIAAALAVAKIFGVPPAVIKKVLAKFPGLPDRQEFIAEIRGVKYINDTTATTPDGAIAALRTFGDPHPSSPSMRGRREEGVKKIILIAGGKDKNLEYGKLAREIKKYCKTVIFFPGTAMEKINYQLSIINYQSIIKVKDMNGAVKKASALAKRGDIVLLSPAAASFGLFQNEFDRGEQFKKAVKSIK